MKRFFALPLVLGVLAVMTSQPVQAEENADHECALTYKMDSIDGETVDLHDYEGKVVLIVNVASKCGLTPQYAGLQDLYQKYQDKGLVVIGFPCNQFGRQEPGTNAEVKQFCSTKYDVTFPMMSKIEVNGDDAAPLYKYLTSKEVGPADAGPISWNFEKFLIGRDGELVHRFSPRTKPTDPKLVQEIESALSN